jgi:sporulation protein YhbH
MSQEHLEPLFTLTHDDWSLHRKGELDQERHKRKVKEAIQKQMSDLIQDDSILTAQNGQVVKVPIKSLDEPRLRYNTNQQNAPHLGQGNGDTQVGDVIGRAPQESSAQGQGQGKAGNQPGEESYDAEMSLEEISAIVFEGWELPRLKPRSRPQLNIDEIRFNDIRKKGMMSNVDKRRTLIEAIKRQAMKQYLEQPTIGNTPFHLGPISNDDLRFKTWELVQKPFASATVLAMMDTSGSMGSFEKRIARTFFFWMVRFLRTKYTAVTIRFLAHHTEAREVSEEQFFFKAESGGTKVSSVYQLANEIVRRDYPNEDDNIYAFHFSDGDNYDSDNTLTVQLACDLLERVNMLGYGEIHQHSRTSGLWEAMRSIRHEAYYHSLLRDPADVYRTLRECFVPKKEASA